jgi:lipid II:glycine glycyltransferase (peptidoglycan interpeptide bridge formation enzyme)
MQIRPIENSEEWNSALVQLGGTLYQCWEWGELRSTQGWRAWRFLVGDSLHPRAAVQVLERRLPILGLSILYAPRGIAVSPSDREAFVSVGTWLKEFVRQRRAILLRVDPYTLDGDDEQRALLLKVGFVGLADQWSRWNLPRSNMIVDISGSKEQILAKMRRSHREYIYRASRSGLVIKSGTELEQLREFYDLLLKTSQRQNFALRDFQYYCQVREKLLISGRGQLFLAYDTGKAVAGIFCTCFATTCHYLHGGFDWGSRQSRPNEALHWQAIQWAKDRGCTKYDLLGSSTRYPPQEGNPGYGIYVFKKGFGAELDYLVGYFDLAGNSVMYRLLRLVESNMRGPLFDAAVKIRSKFIRTPS